MLVEIQSSDFKTAAKTLTRGDMRFTLGDLSKLKKHRKGNEFSIGRDQISKIEQNLLETTTKPLFNNLFDKVKMSESERDSAIVIEDAEVL